MVARQHPSSGSARAAPAQRRTRRWAAAGAVVGLLGALLAFAPASWLAAGVAQATRQHLLLAEAQGTLWEGSALLVLTGGEGSRDAALLPSRLDWRLSPTWQGLRLSLAQACCIAPGVSLDLHPGWGQPRLAVQAINGQVGQWPAAWLEGLGAPLNTLRPTGELRLVTRNLRLQRSQGQWRLEGQAELDLLQASSLLSTLAPLGSYRVTVRGQPAGPVDVILQTLDGALLLSGQGQVGPAGLRFRGEARAAAGQEAPLNNLLNIIGRRNGAASVLSIG